MPRARRRENEMDDQRENDQHHQIEKLSFVYHDRLLETPLQKAKRVPGNYGTVLFSGVFKSAAI
jgi:hypothetical protein